MKTYTVKDIYKHGPCYNPTKHFDPDKSYTLLDFLNHETCPDKDKIWVVTRFLDDKTNRLFAVWCARRALSRVDNPDPIFVKGVDIAEKYAQGKATKKELKDIYKATYNTAFNNLYTKCHKTEYNAAAYNAVCEACDEDVFFYCV